LNLSSEKLVSNFAFKLKFNSLFLKLQVVHNSWHLTADMRAQYYRR
jgi:hypothetical protein